MDDTYLTPLSLFSPSKAAAHRAQAHDWAYLETFLSSLYRGLPPPFERTPSTLSVLLTLAAHNERYDELSSHLARAERAALHEHEDDETDTAGHDNDADIPIREILCERIKSGIAAHDEESTAALRSWACASTILDTSDSSAESIAHSLISLHESQNALEAQNRALENLRGTLATQLETTENLFAGLRATPALKGTPDMPQKTAELARQTKHLRSKIGEYTARLGAWPGESAFGVAPEPLSGAGIAALVREEEDVEVLRDRVVELEAQVEAFAGLPEDPEAAKQKVRRLESEVLKLRSRRDRLFEEMVDK